MEPLLKVEECAEVTRLSPATIYALVHQRRIAHVKLGRALRFRPQDIRDFIESQRRPVGELSTQDMGIRR